MTPSVDVHRLTVSLMGERPSQGDLDSNGMAFESLVTNSKRHSVFDAEISWVPLDIRMDDIITWCSYLSIANNPNRPQDRMQNHQPDASPFRVCSRICIRHLSRGISFDVGLTFSDADRCGCGCCDHFRNAQSDDRLNKRFLMQIACESFDGY